MEQRIPDPRKHAAELVKRYPEHALEYATMNSDSDNERTASYWREVVEAVRSILAAGASEGATA